MLQYENNQHQTSNNAIESIHSKMTKKNTVLEQYYELLQFKVEGFNLLHNCIEHNMKESYYKTYLDRIKKTKLNKTLYDKVHQYKNDNTSRAPDNINLLSINNHQHLVRNSSSQSRGAT